jgi:3'-phosphoadenosine 5'-phosphosulfate sulfotransferase (PAPS reductase)/FAD synthetase
MNESSSTITAYAEITDLLQNTPNNIIITDNLIRAWHIINNPIYERICCSISGGADSDIMLDICVKCDVSNKIDYIWFDTGLEYQATKEHLKFLENKYGIKIIKYKAEKPIPISCGTYGQPFLSKQISEYIHRLQNHNFQWEDEPYEILSQKYPNCQIALKWWCNGRGENSAFNISRKKWLKEFMTSTPPTFKISNKCCHYAKKVVAHKAVKDGEYQLNIVGVRRAEKGARQLVYKSCFDDGNNESYANYRPLFWYKNSDKVDYENFYDISHSKCYSEYGLKRTGCAGCPFGRDFEQELEVIKKYEPKLYKAVTTIFKDSYEYTRKYREFCEKMNKEERGMQE